MESTGRNRERLSGWFGVMLKLRACHVVKSCGQDRQERAWNGHTALVMLFAGDSSTIPTTVRIVARNVA